MEHPLMENVSESLTKNLWQLWKTNHIETQMTWLEVQKLAQQFIKMCQEAQVDHQAIDFMSIVDSKRNYHENLSALDNEVFRFANPQSALDAMGEDYKTTEELKEKIGAVEVQKANLKRKLATQKETQTFDNQEIKKELKHVQDQQAAILAQLANLPDLDQQVNAMLESPIFKDLGKALKPILQQPPPQPPQPQPPTKPAKKQRDYSLLLAFLPSFKDHILDYFAGVMVFVMWIGFSWGIIQNFGLGWPVLAALGVLWIIFVVVFRVVIGGILD